MKTGGEEGIPSEKTEAITLRVEIELSKEFDVLKDAIPFSKKAAIMKECLKIGLAEFKKQRPDVMKMVADYYRSRPEKKRAVG